MTYQHQYKHKGNVNLPVGKVVCIGRNYADHALELDNPVPDEPVLFIKPATAVVSASEDLILPTRFTPIHYEAELSVLIGETLCCASEEQARSAIAGIGVGLDLTRREIQSELKNKQLPWELSKAFDGSCALSPFLESDGIDLAHCRYGLDINGAERQQGNTEMMLTPVMALICHISQFFTLQPGDVVLTGTPKGVGVLNDGDTLTLRFADEPLAQCQCISD
ncbi:fumarylacetoacetate hydrolase family protein [Veronia pacifica]|uniref:Fumarylacetoacetase-like C-terminal domain-containing protein n=2 Tax=Veronia pacifica TaxID=1080227 RepID=A0A1C3ESS7_9GAMM|nr:hypothetical protein A8L45_00660 [Veronia pacifica]